MVRNTSSKFFEVEKESLYRVAATKHPNDRFSTLAKRVTATYLNPSNPPEILFFFLQSTLL